MIPASHRSGRLPPLDRLTDPEISYRGRQAVAPEAMVIGQGQRRLPNTSCIALPGVASEVQVMSLDLAGVAVSAGSACSSGKVAPSHVLHAMGLDETVAGSAIRVSLGWNSTEGDVHGFLDAWRAMVAQASRRGPAAA